MNISYIDKIDALDLVQATINQHVAVLSANNCAKAVEASNGLSKSYHKLYKHTSCSANYTNNFIHLYMRLFSLSDRIE